MLRPCNPDLIRPIKDNLISSTDEIRMELFQKAESLDKIIDKMTPNEMLQLAEELMIRRREDWT